jgi:hypothetical protein
MSEWTLDLKLRREDFNLIDVDFSPLRFLLQSYFVQHHRRSRTASVKLKQNRAAGVPVVRHQGVYEKKIEKENWEQPKCPGFWSKGAMGEVGLGVCRVTYPSFPRLYTSFPN